MFVLPWFFIIILQEAENIVATKVKELAKARQECAEKEATIAAMKIDLQTLNKALEDAKNKVENSEEEVKRSFQLIVIINLPK